MSTFSTIVLRKTLVAISVVVLIVLEKVEDKISQAWSHTRIIWDNRHLNNMATFSTSWQTIQLSSLFHHYETMKQNFLHRYEIENNRVEEENYLRREVIKLQGKVHNLEIQNAIIMNQSLLERLVKCENQLYEVSNLLTQKNEVENSLVVDGANLKRQVRDLEEQSAQLMRIATVGIDEGYWTSLNDLEDDQCSDYEEDSFTLNEWNMSQEELNLGVMIIDDYSSYENDSDENEEWMPFANKLIRSNLTETESDQISDLLQNNLIDTTEEEIIYKPFTNEFYKLVNINPSGSNWSLVSVQLNNLSEAQPIKLNDSSGKDCDNVNNLKNLKKNNTDIIQESLITSSIEPEPLQISVEERSISQFLIAIYQLTLFFRSLFPNYGVKRNKNDV